MASKADTSATDAIRLPVSDRFRLAIDVPNRFAAARVVNPDRSRNTFNSAANARARAGTRSFMTP